MIKKDPNIKSLHSELNLTLDKPATYSIQVIGYLGENWSDRLGGMMITSSSQEGMRPITTLSGPIVDQAALLGVLNALYNLRLPLISVECLDIN